MVSPVDPNEIRLTGENSFIRMGLEQDGPFTTRASHWRVLLSPAGPGHVLYLESELTDTQVRIYSDNIQLARWLQGEIQGTIYAAFGDESVPVTEATFSRYGDMRSFSNGEGRPLWRHRDLPHLVRFHRTLPDPCGAGQQPRPSPRCVQRLCSREKGPAGYQREGGAGSTLSPTEGRT